MLKWILLLIGLALAYWWFVAKKKKVNEKNDTKPENKVAVEKMERMVSCSFCDLHFPEKEAIAHDGRYYCSNKHFEGINQKGWWGKALWRASPNFDDRPEAVDIDLLVIHHISLPPGRFGGPHIIDFFQNKLNPQAHPYFEEIANQRVSSHFLIDRDGRMIQFVPLTKRAWHAGVSTFFERERCNDFSIGVELEGDGESSFTNEQYFSLAQLVEVLQERYPNIRLVGHSDIAPDRKTDPGKTFDWVRLQNLANLKTEKFPFGTQSR